MTLTASKVGTRLQCGIFMVSMARDKKYGIITDVKLTRISMFVWHLTFDVVVKN